MKGCVTSNKKIALSIPNSKGRNTPDTWQTADNKVMRAFKAYRILKSLSLPAFAAAAFAEEG